MRKVVLIGATVVGATVLSASPFSIRWSAEKLSPQHRLSVSQAAFGEGVVLIEDKAHQKAAQHVERENRLPNERRCDFSAPEQMTLHDTKRQDEPIDVDHAPPRSHA